MHARPQPGRTRTRRALVVGARRGAGMRTPCRRERTPSPERRSMSEIPRIAPLANLPLFHKLEGRKAVVVGESEGASWKAELLATAGAEVVRAGSNWTAEQLKDAAIAVADLANRQEALRFVEEAHTAGA